MIDSTKLMEKLKQAAEANAANETDEMKQAKAFAEKWQARVAEIFAANKPKE